MPSIRPSLLFALLLTTLLPDALAGSPVQPDLAREKTWADQIVDMVVVGEPVWLTVRGPTATDQPKPFLGLYTPPGGSRHLAANGIILVHGRGVHPAWGFIDNLRSDLADAGWHTLSLQMPVLASNAPLPSYGATFPAAFARIDAGIEYLKQRGIKTIVLIGHSTGAMTVTAYAAGRTNTPVAGIVGIGMATAGSGNDLMKPALMLARVKVPVLDIYGSDDLPEVLDFDTARRAAAARAGNSDYRAERVAGANHFFTDRYPQLKRAIRDWLRRFEPAAAVRQR